MMQAGKLRLAARDIAVLSLCAALMFALKVALMWLPNIHFGALLIIVFTLTFRYKVFYIIYIYVLLEILVIGFHPMWSIGYLYVWSILAGLVLLFSKMESSLGWAVLAGAFGLSFGALMAPPSLLVSVGPERFFEAFLPYWIAGIPFDIAHLVGNFAICLFLFRPVMRIMQNLECRMQN
jgi:energy-coupling factor transport system substrate-specific component